MKNLITFCIVIAALCISVTALADKAVKPFADGFSGPENLAFDGKGNLYLSDTNHLWKLDMQGQKKVIYTLDPEKDKASICGVSLGPRGKIYFSAGNRILVHDPADASITELVSGLDLANGNCLDDAGNLFIADSNRKVLYVVPAGTSELKVFKEKAGWVNGLVWNRKDNTLYCTISAPGSLRGMRLNDNLEIMDEFTITRFPMGALDDLTLDDQGNFYVCMWGNEKVMKVSPDGNKELLLDKIDGPSALAFGLGDMSDTLFICVKGSTFKFKGTELVTYKVNAQGYRLPFLP